MDDRYIIGEDPERSENVVEDKPAEQGSVTLEDLDKKLSSILEALGIAGREEQ